ncbi:MAG: zinc transporter ZntB [Burkholderiales bacterium]|nr:MAG: zinc transporter ZntB [Burkholderiales bacterium]
MSDQDGLLCAYRLDGRGGADELGWEDLGAVAAGTFLWVHLHLEGEQARAWLRGPSGLSDIVVDALLSEDVRPRCTPMGAGVLVNLRGVNLNPGADPEDMVALRVYVDAQRAVSVRRRKLMAVQDIRDALGAGRGPLDAGGFLVELSARLVERMGPVIAELDDQIDSLEDRALTAVQASLRAELWNLRRVAIGLRRYIAPQREAMAQLAAEALGWVDAQARQRLREVSDRITRYVEDLDAARERAVIVQDELATRLSEQMNRNTYVLSVIAAIFLPLGLLTGLLGINVGGIPGADKQWAFAQVTVGIVVVGVLEFLILRRMRWV